MNRELVAVLRKIQKHIVAEPRRFAMGVVSREGTPGQRLSDFGGDLLQEFNGGNVYESEMEFPDCGTVCCFSGWWRKFTGGEIPEELGDKLVAVRHWPKQFSSRYSEAKNPATRAGIASERIDHFIKTKGRE